MDWIYDIETYPNVFTVCFEPVDAPFKQTFEISDYRNDSKEIIQFINQLRANNDRMVGFNNIGFDYPVIHLLMTMGYSDAKTLYDKAMAIINVDYFNRWTHNVRPSDWFVPQIDLYKIHHFDNQARSTSLKVLEFNMRSPNLEDLPFEPGTVLNADEIEILKSYGRNDVGETKRFYFHSIESIKFREQLTQKYNRNFMNHNDTKIGKDYFIMKLEEAGIPCFTYNGSRWEPRQTERSIINLSDAILPWIEFKDAEFNRVLNWFKSQSIRQTKGTFKDISARVKNFEFVFGLGGIHGSVESEVAESNDKQVIIDIDVKSYYPNLAIANNFYPEHLGPEFCSIYKSLYEQRKSFAKKTAENAMLKLALNGVYGDSNSPYSPFYDPLFTMKITLNGQLLLCKLAEEIMTVYGLRLLQINTDGMTVIMNRDNKFILDMIMKEWEKLTGLELEEVIYNRIFIRDVNNYLAEYEDGSVKRKGAYGWETPLENINTLEREWHSNHSALVVPKVAQKVLLENVNIRETLEKWEDDYDFMKRIKVPKNSNLTIENEAWGETQFPLQNTTRYAVSKNGGKLYKWMPPLGNKTEWRKFSIESGWRVQVCNDLKDFNRDMIDYDYYVQEVEKLCLSLA